MSDVLRCHLQGRHIKSAAIRPLQCYKATSLGTETHSSGKASHTTWLAAAADSGVTRQRSKSQSRQQLDKDAGHQTCTHRPSYWRSLGTLKPSLLPSSMLEGTRLKGCPEAPGFCGSSLRRCPCWLHHSMPLSGSVSATGHTHTHTRTHARTHARIHTGPQLNSAPAGRALRAALPRQEGQVRLRHCASLGSLLHPDAAQPTQLSA